jgi:hypothetical protein
MMLSASFKLLRACALLALAVLAAAPSGALAATCDESCAAGTDASSIGFNKATCLASCAVGAHD